jgi:hypothetical protein
MAGTARKSGQFASELCGDFKNSRLGDAVWLVAFNQSELF